VLAACNPKGTYDSTQPATINLAMSSPLLSRFDLILLLLDTPNREWDNLASTYLLEGIDLLSNKLKSSKFIILFANNFIYFFLSTQARRHLARLYGTLNSYSFI
jgi:DNA replicative helicase MCM subunit Mcm2 (Cdc46/Mcm family)